jgi:hypothetical protein
MMPSKEKIEEIIKKLQKVLKLKDWDIELYLISEYEMKDIMECNHLDTIGCCKRYPNRKLAYVRLNVDHSRIDEEWYKTVIHEMLHIHTCVLDDIALNITEEGSFERKHFDYESETLNCTLEKIISELYPVTNFIKEGDSNA